jgi:hypothetical protein
LPRQNPIFGKFEAKDSLEHDGLWDVYNNFAMGNCGEVAAEKHGISRASQDTHAIESYQRAARAWKEGAFDAEIAPVVIKGKKGDTIVREDEEYKKVIFEKVPSLKSAFKPGGSITAANSSNLNDGASALILMSAEKAKELGLKPLAKVICGSLFRTPFVVHVLFAPQPMPMLVSIQSISRLHPPWHCPWLSRRPTLPSMISPCLRSTKLSLASFVSPRRSCDSTPQRSM